jgi:hypothetical protein
VFAANSRYYGIPVGTITRPDGEVVTYVQRRFLPDPDRLTDIASYVVRTGDRLDRIAASQYGDPEQAWRIADAHRVLDEDVLTEHPGTRLRITMPAGLLGGSGG